MTSNAKQIVIDFASLTLAEKDAYISRIVDTPEQLAVLLEKAASIDIPLSIPAVQGRSKDKPAADAGDTFSAFNPFTPASKRWMVSQPAILITTAL